MDEDRSRGSNIHPHDLVRLAHHEWGNFPEKPQNELPDFEPLRGIIADNTTSDDAFRTVSTAVYYYVRQVQQTVQALGDIQK